jgi:tRNA(Ile)-lysidine synthase
MPRDRLVVATFDHGTGEPRPPHVRSSFGGARARNRGCRRARGAEPLASEERRSGDARWSVLRACRYRGERRIATAHTETDQVETVLMRVMRDAGARGLAALYADTGVATAVDYVLSPANRRLRRRE